MQPETAPRALEALALHSEVEELLFREAALLDRRDYSGWLELFADDGVYWIPAARDDIDPRREVSLVYDDRSRLRERVWRLESGLAYAQEPVSRTCHLVGNVVVEAEGEEELDVAAAFVVTEIRRERRSVHSGRYAYRLRRGPAGLQIVLKKVELIDNDAPLGNLSLVL